MKIQGTGSRQVRSPEGDRRRYNRLRETGLTANIAGQLVDVLDISLSGLRVGGGVAVPDGVFSFSLIPSAARHLDVNNSLPVRGRLARVDARDGSIGIAFERMGFHLAKMIIDAYSRRTGVEPYLFR